MVRYVLHTRSCRIQWSRLALRGERLQRFCTKAALHAGQEPVMSLLDSWKADDKDKLRLHGGALVLYRRPEYASARWQYRLTLPSGGYERRSTDQTDLEAAKFVAEARWQEVQWRSARRLSE